MTNSSVAPAWLSAWMLCNPFSDTKTWIITCGRCRHTWKEKVLRREPSSAICPNPNCRTQNIWSFVKFMEAAEARIAAEENYHEFTTAEVIPLKQKAG